MNPSLFEMEQPSRPSKDILGADTAVLAGFALDTEEELLSSLKDVIGWSPFRNMVTPGGFRMSVAMSNCGSLGWVTDRTGYRYDEIDPEVNRPWPAIPTVFRALAVSAAEEAGFSNFIPDACLINRYEPGARLSFIRTRMSTISLSLSSPSRWDCPQPSFLVVWSAGTKHNAFGSYMAMYLSGEVQPGCAITVLCR
jgi:DNA alkylation damage repair protein AlkB